MFGAHGRGRPAAIGWLGLAALALAAGALGGASARGQGSVAFAPTIATFPDGVMMNATPVVSADRRYVRLGVSPVFTGLIGFDTFIIPAAVRGGIGGGGIGGGIGGGGIGGGGIGGGFGFGGGFASVPSGSPMAPGGYQMPQFDPSFGGGGVMLAAAPAPPSAAPAPAQAPAAPATRRPSSGRAMRAYQKAEFARLRAEQRAAAAYYRSMGGMP
jgi:hypothetical protein